MSESSITVPMIVVAVDVIVAVPVDTPVITPVFASTDTAAGLSEIHVIGDASSIGGTQNNETVSPMSIKSG